ncbi:MAG TPA: NADPH-dependent FMN reductase [Gemmatimonadaceae bacterium]|jgi:NAD(P)H-dependent FMN reductase|nr:NADPH-dependent FMN reductase [Gemmatimonadaceae bacterium]
MNLRILAVSGSLRSGSSNTAVLRAAQLLAPPGVEVALYDALADLPAFNPDLDQPGFPLPRAASDLRARVARAHALIICSPEYAHGIPGALKNLLDWLVGSEAFPGKPVMLVAASERSCSAQAQLAEVLRTMSARLVFTESVVVPVPSRTMGAATIAADPRLGEVLRGAIGALMQAVVRPTFPTPGTFP